MVSIRFDWLLLPSADLAPLLIPFSISIIEVVPWSLWAQAVKVLLILFLNAAHVSPDIQAGNSFSRYQLNYPLTTSIISLYQNIIYIY